MTRKDAGCLLVLALACVALRYRTLAAGDLNVDESQYQASAAYALASGRSPFSLHYLSATIAVYEAAAALFEPYSMPPLRGLVLLLCWATAGLLYLLVARAASWPAGLLAGLVFVHLTEFFEGPSANREWLCLPFLVAGLYACWEALQRERAARSAWMALAGAASAASLAFKEQTPPIVAAIPLFLVLDAFARRIAAGLARDLLSYAAGAAAAIGCYLGLLFAAGGLAEHAAFAFTFFRQYVQANEAAALSGPGLLDLYWRGFLAAPPGRAFFAIGYGMAAATLLQALRAGAAAAPAPFLRLSLLFAANLLASMVAVQMGRRFFGHYYLLLLPAVAALAGLAAHALLQPAAGGSLARRALGGLCFVALLAHLGSENARFFGLAPDTRPAGLPMQALLGWPAAVALLALALAYAVRAGPRLRAPLAAVFALAVAWLALDGHRLRLLRPFWFGRHPDLVDALRTNASPDARLFVWGWAPQIYSSSRIAPASEMVVSQAVVNDYAKAATMPSLEPRYARILMRDLERRLPELIVDAAAVSVTLADDHSRYRLSSYPGFPLNALLRERYEELGRFDDCTLYRLRRPGQ